MAELLALDGRALPELEPELVLEPADDVRGHAAPGNHRVIGIAFPKFRDGRGYSHARILRESGYAGDIRAIGDVTLDQLVYLRRSGFSSVLPNQVIDAATAEAALTRFPVVYQRGADGRQPAWALRHGEDAA